MLFKPRNPVAVPASQRRAGAHGKTLKAERRAARVALARDATAELAPPRLRSSDTEKPD